MIRSMAYRVYVADIVRNCFEFEILMRMAKVCGGLKQAAEGATDRRPQYLYHARGNDVTRASFVSQKKFGNNS